VPNLIADRLDWVGFGGWKLNVRRLMYQTLIWRAVPRDDARGLGPAFDTEGLESQANSLIDGMRRDVKFGRDFFRREMLVDKQEAIQLPPREFCNPLGHVFIEIARALGSRCRIHEHISEQTVPNYSREDPSPKQLTSIRLI